MTNMDTLQNIAADFVGKNLDLYKKYLRYHPEIQSIVYRRLSYKIINQYQVEENIMPYSVLSKKVDKISNLVIDFIKQTKKINTIRRVESTFSPSILKLLLKCIFAKVGIAMDLCSKIQDEKIAASEPPTILDLDVVFDIVRDFEEAKNTIFSKNRKYAPLFKKALGKRLNKIVTQKDNIRTRFGIEELITVREEPNKDGPEIFTREEMD